MSLLMKTEKQKALSQEEYCFLDPELIAEQQRAKQLWRRYNKMEDEADPEKIIPELFGSVGERYIIEPPFRCSYGVNIHAGKRIFFNYGCVILDSCEVRLGDRVMMGPNVHLYTAAHPLPAKPRDICLETALPITIGNHVWIGGGAIILPGVTIGDGAVIGAGSVVTHNIPANAVAVGNPARVVKYIDNSEQQSG